MKPTIEQVEAAAKSADIPPDKIREMLELIASMQPEDEEKPPAVKKQFGVLISDPLGRLPDCDFVAWVVQLPEVESVATVEERIVRTAHDFNTTKKGRLLPVQTVGEACENIPAKMFKENGVWVKTKTPVLVLRTANEIPKTPSVLKEAV